MDGNEELLAKIDELESRIYELEEELESKDREVMNVEASIVDIDTELSVAQSDLLDSEKSVVVLDSIKELVSDFEMDKGNLYNDMMMEIERMNNPTEQRVEDFTDGFLEAIDSIKREF